MSIEINWNKLKEDDGDQLSETIRQFLDQRFQEMTLPSYLKSISVTSFDLGKVAPDIVIQNITDPFAEFYSDDEDGEENDEEPDGVKSSANNPAEPAPTPPPAYDPSSIEHEYPNRPTESPIGPSTGFINPHQQIGVGLYSPTNLQYLSSPLQSNILPGIRSPLYSSVNMQSILSGSLSRTNSPMSNTSNTTQTSNPPPSSASSSSIRSDSNNGDSGTSGNCPNPKASDNDLQLYLHVMYKGDIKIGIETTLLLNYPSPKFVSLPLKLNMCGLEINSIAALAYIDKKMHFSFICDADSDGNPVTLSGKDRVEIIKDIKIESEIGDREGNGPVLRNVGNIERFLLDRLRYLARDELAWPGWITIEF